MGDEDDDFLLLRSLVPLPGNLGKFSFMSIAALTAARVSSAIRLVSFCTASPACRSGRSCLNPSKGCQLPSSNIQRWPRRSRWNNCWTDGRCYASPTRHAYGCRGCWRRCLHPDHYSRNALVCMATRRSWLLVGV